jgi:hypothetical protein
VAAPSPSWRVDAHRTRAVCGTFARQPQGRTSARQASRSPCAQQWCTTGAGGVSPSAGDTTSRPTAFGRWGQSAGAAQGHAYDARSGPRRIGAGGWCMFRAAEDKSHHAAGRRPQRWDGAAHGAAVPRVADAIRRDRGRRCLHRSRIGSSRRLREGRRGDIATLARAAAPLSRASMTSVPRSPRRSRGPDRPPPARRRQRRRPP